MNQKRALCSLVCFIMIVSLVVPLSSSVARAYPATEIWDWYDLDAVRDDLSGSYVLMTTLDSNAVGYVELASPTANEGEGWRPIEAFLGIFDGQGYEIRDLFIDRSDEGSVGLFGSVVAGVIENVGVRNGTVTGFSAVGGLVGTNWGTVSNSFFTGSVRGERNVGGLVGFNGQHGTVTNSYYNHDGVLINGEHVITIGSLFDEDFEEWLANDKSLDVNERLSQEDGYYLIHDVDDLRELLAFGQDASLRFRLQSDLDLATEPNFYIPYLAGEFDGDGHKISNLSFGFGFVTAVGLFGCLEPGASVNEVGVVNVNISADKGVGGVVGYNWGGTVTRSYSTGTVAGRMAVGGLVGFSLYGTVTNSYSTARVSGVYHVGGLAGQIIASIVSNCYSKGSVTGSDSVGGLIGSTFDGTVSNSFWDFETSGQVDSEGGTGKTTAEMKDINTFVDAGWDIDTTTLSDPTGGYPFMAWQVGNSPVWLMYGDPSEAVVGWQSYPVNKAAVMAPWIAALAAIIAGVSLLVLNRRGAHI